MGDAGGRRSVAAAAALAVGLLVAPAMSTRAATTTTVDTAAAWNGTSAIGPFGVPNTATYGQVVTVPATDVGLESFSFHLQLPATTTFRAEVYAWDGSKATGAPQWASTATTTAGTGTFETVSFTPNGVRLVGGAKYVLFLTTSLDGGSGTGRAAFDFAPYSGGEFVFLNNGADPSQWTTTPWVQRSPLELAFTAEFGPGDLPPSASGVALSATEGATFSGTVATTSDPDGGAADMSATVDWGDGTAASAATVVADGGGLDVQGSHAYAEEGSYTVTTTVRDVDAGTTATTTSTATVADATLTATGGSVVAPSSTGDVVLARFADADPGGTTTDYSATVDWGDGSGATGATVAADPAGGFDVHGSHTYAATGPHTVAVHVCDSGGSCADASTSVMAYGVVAGGAFVVGDGTTGTVTWWGPSWARDNHLSGGRAPSSFKGFEDGVAPPACGASWTADTGEDGGARPPRSVPAYMAVVVASSVIRASRDGLRHDEGPVVDGNTVHVVVVHTDPGYGRHHQEGTGTEVAVVC